MNKKIPLWLLLFFLWVSCLITLFFGWSVWYINSGGTLFGDTAGKAILTVAKFPSSVKETFQQISAPSPLIIKDRYPDISGLKLKDYDFIDRNYILLSSYDPKADQCVIRLERLSDQKVLYKWVPDMDEVKRHRDENSRQLEGKINDIYQFTIKRNISLNYPLLADDGAIIFNTEHGPLMKYDKDSKLVWKLNGTFHHGIEYDAEGNIWASSQLSESKFLTNLLVDYQDESISKVSPDGKLLFTKSVNEILYENGYRGLLFGVGPLEDDPLHLNDVQPALSSGPYWNKGDLLISLRNKSTVLLYRPETNKIVWLQTGPWLYQHDVDFIDDSRIGVYGNNVIRNKNFDFIDKYNEQYIYDFRTQKLSTPYAQFLSRAKVSTRIGGQSQVLENGDLFVEESVYGRLLRGNQQNTIWEYVDRIDKNSAAVFFWSRIMSPEEIEKYKFIKN